MFGKSLIFRRDLRRERESLYICFEFLRILRGMMNTDGECNCNCVCLVSLQVKDRRSVNDMVKELAKCVNNGKLKFSN